MDGVCEWLSLALPLLCRNGERILQGTAVGRNFCCG